MTDVLEKIMEQVHPCGESEIIDDLFGPFRDAATRGDIPVVIFCAGASGRILHPLLTKHGIRPACFCDNNPSRGGEVLCGSPIIPFDELKRRHRESLILIASAAYQNFVKAQLLDHGFRADRILTLDTEDTSCDAQIRRERILMFARNGEPTAVLEQLRQDRERIAAAFDLLADNKSRQLFIRRLALVASGYEYHAYRDYLKDFSEPVQRFGYDNPERLAVGGSFFYFTNDVLRLRDGEILVDGGAYSGDSAEEFVRACGDIGVRYGHMYCFEPDLDNYRKLVEHTSNYRDVTCLNRGLWSGREVLRFVSSAKTESFGARIQESDVAAHGTADTDIETTSIDLELSGREATLIKMDVEGAEIEAIRGAAETLRNHRPQLALSVYHRTSDMYEIPLLVHEVNPGYTLYLRHLGNYFDDTILFAVA